MSNTKKKYLSLEKLYLYNDKLKAKMAEDDASILADSKSYIDTELKKYYTKTEIDSYELITIDEIDAICGAVTEGSLESTDVDYLMAQLNYGVSTDELSPEEIEKLMNKLS